MFIHVENLPNSLMPHNGVNFYSVNIFTHSEVLQIISFVLHDEKQWISIQQIYYRSTDNGENCATCLVSRLQEILQLVCLKKAILQKKVIELGLSCGLTRHFRTIKLRGKDCARYVTCKDGKSIQNFSPETKHEKNVWRPAHILMDKIKNDGNWTGFNRLWAGSYDGL